MIGSKEGIAHFPLAVLNPGDISLVPDPCYPVYRSSSMFAGGDVYTMPLEPGLGFLPDLEAIPADVFALARLMFLNYPNNPTGASADLSFYEKVVSLAGTHGFVVAQDAAYNEMYFDQPAPSILQVPGAKDVAIEFHSLSKTFNMTGWRVGFAVGGASDDRRPRPGKGERRLGNLHGDPVRRQNRTRPVRYTHAADPGSLQGAARRVRRRPQQARLEGPPPDATFYVWIPCPDGYTSTQLCSRLLEEADVVTTPGLGFGRTTDGYIRAALTVETPRLLEAIERIGRLKI